MNSFSAISLLLSRCCSSSRISISRLVKESTKAWGLGKGELEREGDSDRRGWGDGLSPSVASGAVLCSPFLKAAGAYLIAS
jgi:hypothetical protein